MVVQDFSLCSHPKWVGIYMMENAVGKHIVNDFQVGPCRSQDLLYYNNIAWNCVLAIFGENWILKHLILAHLPTRALRIYSNNSQNVYFIFVIVVIINITVSYYIEYKNELSSLEKHSTVVIYWLCKYFLLSRIINTMR